ncbi:MAG: fructosamine kinase family protein [Acidimicrobiales bacterium]|nr:fructosamine kinase family protein [Acidimicrobiales bacterium]
MVADRSGRMEALRDAVGRNLGAEVASLAPVHGGDVAEAFRVGLADGCVVFAKTHRRPPPDFFDTEAAGLTWLRGAGTVAVPEVLAVLDDPPALVLEWIDEGRPGPTTEADLGRALAALHAAGAPCFGREDRRTTGSRGLPNEPHDTWAAAFAANRLLPLARLARDEGALPEPACRDLEAVADRLPELGGPPEPPARLHGDLWAGNRLVGAGGVNWLIDPAAQGGHREFDLAMMRLFGGFGGECFAAYAEASPLADGWEARVPLHQLAPLAVHAIKFGGSYVGATQQALAAVLKG